MGNNRIRLAIAGLFCLAAAHAEILQTETLRGDSFDPSEGKISAMAEVKSPYPALFHGPENAKTISITIDDGPSPVYTPQILDVLARHRVRATFFMIGEMAAAHPELVRKVNAAGHEIGNHTYHHLSFCTAQTPEKSALLDREIMTSADAIQKADGVKLSLLRMPYGCHEPWIHAEIHKLGYERPILWSVDGEDWKMPGVDVLVKRYLDGAKPGAILLMHDGGGDRSQTVKALDAILTGLEKKGMGTLTVGEMLALQKSAEKAAAASSESP